MSKIKFKYNLYDNNYLMIDIKKSLVEVVVNNDIDVDVRNQAYSMYYKYLELERSTKKNLNDSYVSFNKNSILGDFILKHEDIFLDEGLEVTYQKIVNAFNVALFSNNAKISNKIYPLFKERISGTKNELMSIYNEDILDYILCNDNFSDYLDEIDGKVKNYDYFVYENNDYIVENNVINKKMIKK